MIYEKVLFKSIQNRVYFVTVVPTVGQNVFLIHIRFAGIGDDLAGASREVKWFHVEAVENND